MDSKLTPAAACSTRASAKHATNLLETNLCNFEVMGWTDVS